MPGKAQIYHRCQVILILHKIYYFINILKFQDLSCHLGDIPYLFGLNKFLNCSELRNGGIVKDCFQEDIFSEDRESFAKFYRQKIGNFVKNGNPNIAKNDFWPESFDGMDFQTFMFSDLYSTEERIE